MYFILHYTDKFQYSVRHYYAHHSCTDVIGISFYIQVFIYHTVGYNTSTYYVHNVLFYHTVRYNTSTYILPVCIKYYCYNFCHVQVMCGQVCFNTRDLQLQLRRIVVCIHTNLSVHSLPCYVSRSLQIQVNKTVCISTH